MTGFVTVMKERELANLEQQIKLNYEKDPLHSCYRTHENLEDARKCHQILFYLQWVLK